MSTVEQQEQQQPQKRPTLQFAADAGAGTIGGGVGAVTGTDPGMSSSSPATTPLSGGVNIAGFLPDMPQWKKDLIQRRKTNVARTNAAACSPTSLTPQVDGSYLAFSEPADSGATDATATATITTSQQQQQQLQQQQQKYMKRNVSQTQKQDNKTSPTEEKSENCFIGAGGHHTLPALTTTPATIIATTTTATAQSIQGKDLAFSTETAASAAATTTAGSAPIPKQRSSLLNARSQSTGKEQEILNLDTRERERERERELERERTYGEREREIIMDVEVNNTGSHNRWRSRASGEVETGTTTAPTTGALTAIGSSGISSSSNNSSVAKAATSSSSANQLQTKCKLGQSGAEATPAILPLHFTSKTNNTPIISDKNCKSKISDKLQNNKFIQNQNQQQQQQQQQQQLAASPTKVAVKTTMVAMQEMKKTTTQNGQHRHHHHHQAHHHNHNQHVKSAENENDGGVAAMQAQLVDNNDHSEDLSYGPGIVSKLRCRYLSLALQCETRQQCQKQRLQRSTSLNTLLDRNDDDDEELNSGNVNANVNANDVTTPTASVSSAQRNAGAQPPPILGVKPSTILTTGSGYNKSVNIMQRQQLRQQQEQTQMQQQQSHQQQQQQTNGTSMRSRHFKRGNEVMKRARSVEALLCEKSPWNTQRASYQASTTITSNNAATAAATIAASAAVSASASSTCVTIEDKINNARERLHSGTDTSPPKRLTSIIDDTERPPPDLVKQTLKMFEASANRRPRAAQRSNGVGGVASKVANYKSIIKEQKPTHKRDLMASSPIQMQGFAASTPKQRSPHNSHTVVPDIIPRQLDASGSSTFDSPVSQLCKVMERLQQEATPDAGLSIGIGGGNVVSQRLVNDKRTKAAVAAAAGAVGNNNDRNDIDDNNEDNNEGNDNDVADDDNEDGSGNDADANATATATFDSTEIDVCNGDNMGAVGDKLTQAALPFDEPTATATGGVQRSFVAALHENAHVNSASSSSSSGSISNRKLTQRGGGDIANDYGSPTAAATPTKQIGVIRPLLSNSNQQATGSGSGSGTGTCITPLTSREIEKNRINEMKKSTALAADAAAAAAAAGTPTSLDTVINTKDASETDAGSTSTTPSGISPIWSLRKRRQPNTGNSNSSSIAGGSNTENTSMVFNFSKSTKEVPDYIESDVIFRPKRELPKPNEPGFVLLGDLSVETSTDTDYDDYSMCPPSPCDVEFENANIVIDGKSSIRQKSKESSFRVQFNDTLTSTFEYPSEASQIIDDPPYADPYGNVNKHHQLLYEEHRMTLHQQQHQQQQQHHHVTVDEIIELPTSTTSSSTPSSTSSIAASHKSSATSAMLGNLPLGSTALGFYTPVKASPMDSLFQLGVTRYTTPDSNSSNSTSTSNGSPAAAGTANTTCNGNGVNDDDASIGRKATGGINDELDDNDYLTAGGIVYSEGTQKTDLLY